MCNGFMLFIFQLNTCSHLSSIWTSPMTLQECPASEGIQRRQQHPSAEAVLVQSTYQRVICVQEGDERREAGHIFTPERRFLGFTLHKMQRSILKLFRHYWINMIYVWILVYLVSCELQARQRSWASHCCQSSNQGRERDVDETSCNIKPETLPQKDSFPNKKDQKGIRWNKDPLFGKLKASEQQGTKGSWRIGKEARTFPTVFTLEHLVPCSVAPTFDNLLIPKWLSLHGQLWNLFLISTSKLCPAFETRWLGFASLTTKMDSS